METLCVHRALQRALQGSSAFTLLMVHLCRECGLFPLPREAGNSYRLTLVGGPCVPSGGPVTNGTRFPISSTEKVLTPGSLACFARLVVQTVLLFGCESWTTVHD